jgi:hypothetical protein
MLKYPSLMGIFPLPPLYPTTNVAPLNMFSSFTSGSLGFVDTWVVPHPKEVESYGASLPLTPVEIVDLTIESTSIDIGQQIHPHME